MFKISAGYLGTYTGQLHVDSCNGPKGARTLAKLPMYLFSLTSRPMYVKACVSICVSVLVHTIVCVSVVGEGSAGRTYAMCALKRNYKVYFVVFWLTYLLKGVCKWACTLINHTQLSAEQSP